MSRRSLHLMISVLVLFLATAWEASASPGPTLAIQPATVSDVQSGGTFAVNVTIADVSELYGWQVNVTFNPQVLNVERTLEGGFLKQVNETVFIMKIDNTLGYALITGVFEQHEGGVYPPHGASGSGLLCNITFSVKGSGSSPMQLSKKNAPGGTYLRSLSADVIAPITDFSTVDGSFSNSAGGLQLGVPFELLVGAVVAVVAVVGVAGFYIWRRRKGSS